MPIDFGYFKELGNTAFVDHANKRFGIGVSTPLATLHVQPAADVNLRVLDDAGGRLKFRVVNDADSVIDFLPDAWRYRFFVNGTERLTIDSNGSVGIGTITPNANAKLHVVGQYASDLYSNGNSGASMTIDWANANAQEVTLTANCTFTFSNAMSGGRFALKLKQDATGSRTVTWPAAVKWSGGTAPTLTTTANKEDIITFWFAGTTYYGASILDY